MLKVLDMFYGCFKISEVQMLKQAKVTLTAHVKIKVKEFDTHVLKIWRFDREDLEVYPSSMRVMKCM